MKKAEKSSPPLRTIKSKKGRRGRKKKVQKSPAGLMGKRGELAMDCLKTSFRGSQFPAPGRFDEADRRDTIHGVGRRVKGNIAKKHREEEDSEGTAFQSMTT